MKKHNIWELLKKELSIFANELFKYSVSACLGTTEQIN